MIPPNLIPQLGAAANPAVKSSLKIGAARFRQNTPTGEVGFVAAFVLGAVPDIAAAWRPILRPHGYSVKMTSVFCHQTPRASFTDSAGAQRSCELADLLIVVDDYTKTKPGQRWAALIQAKMAKSGGGQTLSGQGDRTQFDLMSNWPSFTLPSAFAPGRRDFKICPHPGSALDCGRYGLIEPQPNPRWQQYAPALSMPPGGQELGTFIAHMVEQGQTGYGREATGSRDDWSRTVDELLTITAAQTFTYKTGFRTPQSRGHSAIARMFAMPVQPPPQPRAPSGGSAGMAPPSGGKTDVRFDGEPEGVSVLRIEIRSLKAG